MSQKKGLVKAHTGGLIIDSSVAIAWCFTDEQDDYSPSILDTLASEQAFVPYLWHLEVANILLVGERRKRSTQSDTVHWQNFLASLPIIVDEETNAHAFGAITDLGRLHGLSAYDAAYLELAMRRGLPLASLDAKLNAAAEAVGVTLYGVR